MPTQTFPFDAARYVQTPEAQTAYLNEALSSGNATEILDAIATIARAKGIAEDNTVKRGVTGEGGVDLLPMLRLMEKLGLRLSVSAV